MRKRFLYCAFALIALFLANYVLASELTDDYFLIAVNYYNTKNYAKAMEYLDTILIVEPDNLKTKTLRSKILPLPGGVRKIENCTDTSLENSSGASFGEMEKVVCSSDYYNSKGQELYIKKEFDNAIKYFYKAVRADDKNSQAYNNLGMAYWLKRDTTVAILYFKKASSIDKTYTQPLVNLAMLYKQLGNEKRQVYYLNNAIKANPKDFLAYYCLGDYYRNKLDYHKAIQYYKETIKICPSFSQTYLDLAICFYETRQFNYALMALGQYRELYPDSDYAFYLLAKTNMAMENYKDSKANIEKALAINNTNEYQLELAKADYYLQDYNAALNILDGLQGDSQNIEVPSYLALCNYYLKNTDMAIDIINTAIVKYPDEKSLYLTKLKIYELMQDNSRYNEMKNLIEVRFKTK